MAKQNGTPRTGKRQPRRRAWFDEAYTRWDAVVKTWDTLDKTGRGLELQAEDLRSIAEEMKMPYVAALVLNGQLTSQDLVEWAAWSLIERDVFMKVTKDESVAEKES